MNFIELLGQLSSTCLVGCPKFRFSRAEAVGQSVKSYSSEPFIDPQTGLPAVSETGVPCPCPRPYGSLVKIPDDQTLTTASEIKKGCAPIIKEATYVLTIYMQPPCNENGNGDDEKCSAENTMTVFTNQVAFLFDFDLASTDPDFLETYLMIDCSSINKSYQFRCMYAENTIPPFYDKDEKLWTSVVTFREQYVSPVK